MKIIGIAGKALQGKDTCAKLISEMAREMGKVLLPWSLAHPLKAVVYAESRGDKRFEDIWYTKPPEERKLLQARGEGGRIEFGNSYWTLQSEGIMRALYDTGVVDGFILPDVRYLNEVDFIKLGGSDPEVVYRQIAHELEQEMGYTAEYEMELLNSNRILEMMELDAALYDGIESRWAARLKAGTGIALCIVSDRPTLEGTAATHPSEVGLSQLDPNKDFSGVIINNRTTTFDDLKEQLRPYVIKLLE
jgi:hypothetical protein